MRHHGAARTPEKTAWKVLREVLGTRLHTEPWGCTLIIMSHVTRPLPAQLEEEGESAAPGRGPACARCSTFYSGRSVTECAFVIPLHLRSTFRTSQRFSHGSQTEWRSYQPSSQSRGDRGQAVGSCRGWDREAALGAYIWISRLVLSPLHLASRLREPRVLGEKE